MSLKRKFLKLCSGIVSPFRNLERVPILIATGPILPRLVLIDSKYALHTLTELHAIQCTIVHKQRGIEDIKTPPASQSLTHFANLLSVAYMDRLPDVRRTASAGLMHNLPKMMVVPDSAGDAS
jgi:hypothetical protein